VKAVEAECVKEIHEGQVKIHDVVEEMEVVVEVVVEALEEEVVVVEVVVEVLEEEVVVEVVVEALEEEEEMTVAVVVVRTHKVVVMGRFWLRQDSFQTLQFPLLKC
jgi:hypothetical protein